MNKVTFVRVKFIFRIEEIEKSEDILDIIKTVRDGIKLDLLSGVKLVSEKIIGEY